MISALLSQIQLIIYGVIIIFALYFLYKYDSTRIIVSSLAFIVLIATGVYSVKQVNGYYFVTGTTYGEATTLFNANDAQFERLDDFTFKFTKLGLKKTDIANQYRTRVQDSNKTILNSSKHYAIYLNEQLLTNNKQEAGMLSADAKFSYRDTNNVEMILDTLHISFSFENNITEIVLTTDGGDIATGIWDNFLARNNFILSIKEVDLIDSDIEVVPDERFDTNRTEYNKLLTQLENAHSFNSSTMSTSFSLSQEELSNIIKSLNDYSNSQQSVFNKELNFGLKKGTSGIDDNALNKHQDDFDVMTNTISLINGELNSLWLESISGYSVASIGSDSYNISIERSQLVKHDSESDINDLVMFHIYDYPEWFNDTNNMLSKVNAWEKSQKLINCRTDFEHAQSTEFSKEGLIVIKDYSTEFISKMINYLMNSVKDAIKNLSQTTYASTLKIDMSQFYNSFIFNELTNQYVLNSAPIFWSFGIYN